MKGVENMALEDKTEKRKVGGREITVVALPLTQKEARAMFSYRPVSRYAESRFGGNELYDDVCLLLNELAKRCPMCQAPTKTEYLKPYCPDCDGRSEMNGADPRQKELPSHLQVHLEEHASYDGDAD